MGETSARVRETWEGNDAAILGEDAELALSLERRACHLATHVAGSGWRHKNL
jgi:hypothetical protein